MKKLTSLQREAWEAIAKFPKHPWHNLAIKALDKDQSLRRDTKKIKAVFKQLINS